MSRPDRPTVLTHRGLEARRTGFFEESTYEAFADHLSRGFGIEFDVAFVRDGIIVTHDATLERLTHGQETGAVEALWRHDVTRINARLTNGRVCFLEELLDLVARSEAPVSALHLKGRFQRRESRDHDLIDRLLSALDAFPQLGDRIIVFDVAPAVAQYIRRHRPRTVLAASVAHCHDVERFGRYVGDTLLTPNEVLAHRTVYDWAWLDEWDLSGAGGSQKMLYTPEIFSTLREAGLKLAVVSPELHATSPGLLGGESHPDARSFDILQKRMRSIISLRPNAICTDYPEVVRAYIEPLD